MALWKIDVHLISTLVNKSLYYYYYYYYYYIVNTPIQIYNYLVIIAQSRHVHIINIILLLPGFIKQTLMTNQSSISFNDGTVIKCSYMSPCNIHSFTNNSDTCDSSIIDDEHNIHYQKHHTRIIIIYNSTCSCFRTGAANRNKTASIKEHCRKMRLHDVLFFYQCLTYFSPNLIGNCCLLSYNYVVTSISSSVLLNVTRYIH